MHPDSPDSARSEVARVTIRGRIEDAFASWGRLVIRWRWVAIVAVALSTAVLGSFVPDLRVDNSEEAFLMPDDPERLLYDRFRELFDREDRVVIAVRAPEIFSFVFLERLRDLHRDLEESVPHLDEVTSLVNARNTRGEGDQLIVEDLMEEWPRSEGDLERLRERVLANPLYRNILISESGRMTTVSVKPDTYSSLSSSLSSSVSARDDALEGFGDAEAGEGEEARYLTEPETFEMVGALRAVVERHNAADFELYPAGGPVLEYSLTRTMQRDSTLFMALALAIIFLFLGLLFRRPSGVLLPLLVVVASAVSTVGIMVLLDVPFSMTFNILPAFLFVVGICDSIHILVIVYQRLAAGVSKEQAVVDALRHSGLAVLMTSVTTACGLLSFSLAEVQPIAQLGIIAPIGVMFAMVYTLVLMPALMAVLPIRSRIRPGGLRRKAAVDGFLAAVGDLATRYPWQVLGITALILLLGLGGLVQLRFSHNGLKWFPDADPMRVAAELLDDEFKGASRVEVLIHTSRENGLHEPDTLARLEEAMRRSETLEVDGRPVAKAVSIVDVVKETHQALNENRSEYYVLPRERELIAQELLLFENSGSDDLTEVTDTGFQTARMTVRTPWVDAMLYPDFLVDLREVVQETLGEGVEIEMTSGAVLFTRVFRGVIVSMARSYVFAFAVIVPILVLLVGDLRRGLTAVIPNLVPIYLVLSLMGWMGIPIDVSTLLIGGIVLGLAVDDTIHFMHKFNRYYEESGDARSAVHETLVTTGSALLFTSLVLATGFSVFLAAYLNNVRWFGLLASFATIVAFLADVLLAPALMVLVCRGAESRRPSRGEPADARVPSPASPR